MVDGDGGKWRTGQPIRIGAPGFFKNAFVKSVTSNADHTATVTLDQNLEVPVGAKVSNPLWNGQSFKVLNCHIGFTRSRGIVVKADEGLIQGNVITDCGLSGVSAGPGGFFCACGIRFESAASISAGDVRRKRATTTRFSMKLRGMVLLIPWQGLRVG